MTIERFLFIANIQMTVFAIGAVLCFIKFKTRQLYIRLLGFALLASVCGDLLSYICRRMHWGTNYGPSTYQIVVIPIFAAVFYHMSGKNFRNVFVSTSTLHVFFGLINVLFIQKEAINSYTLVSKSILLILYSLIYFYWLLKELPTTQLHRLPAFWISSAILFYSAGGLFLFAFTDYLVHVLNDDLFLTWSLHNFLGMFQGFIIACAIILDIMYSRVEA